MATAKERYAQIHTKTLEKLNKLVQSVIFHEADFTKTGADDYMYVEELSAVLSNLRTFDKFIDNNKGPKKK